MQFTIEGKDVLIVIMAVIIIVGLAVVTTSSVMKMELNQELIQEGANAGIVQTISSIASQVYNEGSSVITLDDGYQIVCQPMPQG